MKKPTEFEVRDALRRHWTPTVETVMDRDEIERCIDQYVERVLKAGNMKYIPAFAYDRYRAEKRKKKYEAMRIVSLVISATAILLSLIGLLAI